MIWTSVGATLFTAGLAGALAVPAARRVVLGDVKTDWLQDELELDRIEADGATVKCKNGTISRVWRIEGTSFDAKVLNEQQNLMRGRAALLQELAKRRLNVRLFGVKRRRPISYDVRWPSPALQEIGDAEAAVFKSSYYVDWYIVCTGYAMTALVEAHDLIMSMIADYRPRPLLAADKATSPCPLTGFLNGLVSGDFRADLPAISRNLSGALPGSDLEFNRSTGVIQTHTPLRQLQKIITVSLWPDIVTGRMIGELLAIDGDIEVCQILEPWDRDSATVFNKRRERAFRNSLFGNATGTAETSLLLNLLNEDAVAIFATQFQVTVRAGDEKRVDDLVREVTEIFGNLRIIHRIQTSGAPSCWFARIPVLGRQKGKLIPGGRMMAPLDLREENVAALWAFQHSATGQTASQFGNAPVRMFRTPAGQAYAFQFQVSDKPQSRGNFLMFAPTGGGKSTLLMHILGGLAKFEGVPSYIFDSKEGARFMVEAFGGVYQNYDNLSLNPLDVGPDTPENRNRVFAILRAMAGGSLSRAEDTEALAHAAELAFQIEPPQRTLSAIYPFAFTKRTDLRREFAKWVIDDKGNKGRHAHVFNAPNDSLGGLLDHHMVAVNMNEALDDPELGPPVVAHIAAAIGKSAAASKRGFAIFIDEAAKLLQNPGFRDLAIEMFREYRKLDGAVGLAFQDPAALTRSGHAEAFIENTSTFIFLPNAQAKPDSFEPFNLNDEQMEFVTGAAARPGQRRALVIKRDAASGFDESAIIDVDLSPLGDALRFYRAGVKANQELDALKERWGAEWRKYL
jgi:type IV secretion system protein VirB4|tara:strand:- start:41865 stop:44252 length:2388 start_codon:yes stop_codon:yes gene_type:complete